MPFRFKVDANLPIAIKTVLVEGGHDALTVVDQKLGGQENPTVFSVCKTEDRILVTLDLDFSDIRMYEPGSHPGIWILRPTTQSIDNCVALVRGALALSKTEAPETALWIIEPGKIRVRTTHET